MLFFLKRIKIGILSILALLLISSHAMAALEIQAVFQPTALASRILNGTLEKVKAKYGSKITIRIVFMVEEDAEGHYFSSLGDDDFQELLRCAVVRQEWPGKFWDYLASRNSEMYNPVWEQSAAWAGIPPEALKACLKQYPAKKWLASDRQVTRRYNLKKAPSIIMDDQVIFQGETGLPELDVAIRRRLPGKDIHPRRHIKVYYDSNTPQPQWEQAKAYYRQYVAGLEIEPQQVDESKADELLAKQITVLPAIFMDEGFTKSYYADYLFASPGKTFQGWFHLATPFFADTLLDRERMPGHVRVIMQAHCPGSVSLLRQLMANKSKNEIKALDFPFFLYEPKAPKTAAEATLEARRGFTALHGDRELEETARQLIIQKNAPAKYWDYLNHLYSLGLNSWEEALGLAGIQKKDIENKISSEGLACLEEHYKVVGSIPVGQSPVLLIDNRYLVSDIASYFNGAVKIEGSCGVSR